MNIQDFISQKKELQNYVLINIDNDEDSDNNFKNLANLIENKQISKNRNELYEFNILLSKIINNHHRFHGFYDKISRIFDFLANDIKQTFSNIELYNIFKGNLLFLPYLFEKQIILFDYYIFHDIITEAFTKNDISLIQFFLPEIKPFIPLFIQQISNKDEMKNNKPIKLTNEDNDGTNNNENDILNIIQKIIEESSTEIPPEFFEKRRKGENDSYICEMIRQDLIDDFIKYINQTNISCSSQISPSFFETNSFLLKNKSNVTLIEYAAFFGSIQILKYLENNKVELNLSLWLFAIHSNNAEIIAFLEEKNIPMPKSQYKKSAEKCLKESIECHHNDIAYYIIQQFDLSSNVICKYCFRFYNYEFYQDDFIQDQIIEAIIQYDHVSLFEILFNQNEIKLQTKIIFFQIFLEFLTYIYLNDILKY